MSKNCQTHTVSKDDRRTSVESQSETKLDGAEPIQHGCRVESSMNWFFVGLLWLVGAHGAIASKGCDQMDSQICCFVGVENLKHRICSMYVFKALAKEQQ